MTKRRHLLISGTGRAGTSFLVKYLSALGLETTLTASDAPYWDEAAEAGLEQMPFVNNDIDLPYVIKWPGAAELLAQILKDDRYAIDGMIVPIRDLADAAASRAVLEMRAIHAHQLWRTDLDEIVPTHGTTPGGILYSLHPLDQERVLATAFHKLVRLAADAEIPLVFPAFPRMVQEGDHLWRTIRRFLPSHITEARALEAHALLASESKVRIEAESSEDGAAQASSTDLLKLDNIALRRELQRLRNQLTAATSSSED